MRDISVGATVIWSVFAVGPFKVARGGPTAIGLAEMMAGETGTSRGKNSSDSLMKIRLDVSREPLDLRSWPES